MATPSRRDQMIKNLMRQRKNAIKEAKYEEPKEKDPEAVKNIIELWKKAKEKKKNGW